MAMNSSNYKLSAATANLKYNGEYPMKFCCKTFNKCYEIKGVIFAIMIRSVELV